MVQKKLELVSIVGSLDRSLVLKNGNSPRFSSPVGPVRTINIKHPACPEYIVEQIASKNKEILRISSINAVQISDYNPDTSYVKNEGGFSSYAYQFYVCKK